MTSFELDLRGSSRISPPYSLHTAAESEPQTMCVVSGGEEGRRGEVERVWVWGERGGEATWCGGGERKSE